MRSFLLTLSSLVLSVTVIGNAYYQKKQFYPSVVYVTKSNPSMAVIYIQAFVLVILTGKIMRKVFFGQLRAAELEHLIERSWYAITETCLAFTVFRDDFSPKFVALFTLLLFLKCFHWLADDRVDYMERSPMISVLFHARVICLLLGLGLLDAHFVNMAYFSTLTKGATVQLVFGFEYAILLMSVLNIFIKYFLHAIDLQSDNPWETKAVFLLYTELVMGFIKVVFYMIFMVIMIKIHTFPLFAIRPMYLTLRAFKKALNDVIMSRRAIRNMNTLYPDASPEELASADNVCIICREEMFSASKKLPCNHIFHSTCLRSWFQRQQTCPTCRMDVLRTATPIPQQPPPPQQQQQAQAPPQQQQQQQQPFFNFPGFFPGLFPPGAMPPMWAQMPPPAVAAGAVPTPPPVPQPAQSQPQTQTSSPSGGGTPSPSGSAPQTSIPPMVFPPFPFMPFMIPLPRPPANFSGLTDEELHAMEGQERQHVEARIECLSNIQTLLDAAVVQLQQYAAIVSTLPPPVITSNSKNESFKDDVNKPSTSKQNNDAAASTSNDPQQNMYEDDSSFTIPGSEESSTSLDEKEQLRRRRLQRFDEKLSRDDRAMELD
uniref:RING-type E3 ubiquitin transferase n=1 Tax=Strigamia maritima TaxID=126957 RepID=T1IPZ3_STRMM